MTFSDIQRRAFLIALATVVCLLVAVMGYWHGVRKGALPSPIEPIVPQPQAALPPVTMTARPVPTPEFPTANPTEQIPLPDVSPARRERVSEKLGKVAEASARDVTVESTKPAPSDIATTELTTKKPESPASSTQRECTRTLDVAAKRLAADWLSSTNNRPIIRVHYELTDLFRLVESGRGLIVASSQGTVPPREVYLQSRPDGPPLFAPYTKSVAGRFSTYSLSLNDSSGLAHLWSALPPYFPNVPVTLAFVPDDGVAREIFVPVARASRSFGGELTATRQAIFEGELSLNGTEPRFELLEVGSGTNRVQLNETR